MFLSSNQIRILETAFQDVMAGETVKQAEEVIQRLRNQNNFQICLATFMTRSRNYNERLLAVLQLKKILILKEQQTVWMLKQIYYNDVDKIADIIKQMVTYTKNIVLAAQFLNYNFDQMGTVEAIRYIQLVFSLLKSPDRAEVTILNHFQLLYEGLLLVLQVVIECQDLLFMLMVVLIMFYHNTLHITNIQNIDKLKQHWWILYQKSKFYSTPNLLIIRNIISSILCQKYETTPNNCIFDLFLQVLKYSSLATNVNTRYYSMLIKLAVEYLNLLQDTSVIINIIEAFQEYASRKNQTILIDSKMNRPIQLHNTIEKDIQSKQQKTIRQTMCLLIQQIFVKHYKEIFHIYNRYRGHSKTMFISLLPLVNFYNSTQNQIIQTWAKDNIQNVVNYIGNILHCYNINQNIQQKQKCVKICISLVQFLIKYKYLSQIALISHTVILLQSLSKLFSSFSPLCYNFMNHVWQCLASLSFDELSEFLLKHVRELNQNQWDYRLENYCGFLNLAKTIQQSYQFYSKFLIDDALIRQSIRAHQIMISLFIQNEQKQINHEILAQLILLTSYFIEGLSQQNYRQFYNGLNINYLSNLIEKHKLYTIQSADIVAFDLMVSNLSNSVITKEYHEWQIDQDDCFFYIELQLMEICYSQQQNNGSTQARLIEQFAQKLNRFLYHLTMQKLQDFKNTKIWWKYLGLIGNNI